MSSLEKPKDRWCLEEREVSGHRSEWRKTWGPSGGPGSLLVHDSWGRDGTICRFQPCFKSVEPNRCVFQMIQNLPKFRASSQCTIRNSGDPCRNLVTHAGAQSGQSGVSILNAEKALSSLLLFPLHCAVVQNRWLHHLWCFRLVSPDLLVKWSLSAVLLKQTWNSCSKRCSVEERPPSLKLYPP